MGSGVQIEVWDVKERGMFISYSWSGKRNREETQFVVERREMERFHIKWQFQQGCLLVEEWRGKEGASSLECGKVEYAVGNALGS